MVTMAALNKESSDYFSLRRTVLLLVVDLKTSMSMQGWCGGGGILVVDLCPRTPLLRWQLHQRWRGAWEVVHERVQIVVCIDCTWKIVDRMLGSWFVGHRYGFHLWCPSRAVVSDLEFDNVSGVLALSDLFNNNGFAFGVAPVLIVIFFLDGASLCKG